MKKLITSFLLLALSLLASAYDCQVDGICYNLISKVNEAEVTFKTTDYNSYTATVVIPEKITYEGVDYSVTSIGKNAFRDCNNLVNVSIPNSVTSIGSGAFWNCYNLISMVIPISVKNIGGSAFYSCTSLSSVTIPSSITSIGYRAFDHCSGLTSVIIPSTVVTIEEMAFCQCSALTAITIPNSVISIGKKAFYQCSSLTSMTIPNSITSIGEYAFHNCTGLISVFIPNSVTSIGEYAFSGCSSLTSVNFPESWTGIVKGLFSGCRSLTSVTIPNSITSIGENAFGNCSGLTSITIPNTVKTIRSNTFYKCSGLTSVIIPNSVTYIESFAFYGCSGLSSVTIPKSVTRIGQSAFYDCINLSSVHITDISAWCNIDFDVATSTYGGVVYTNCSSNPLSSSHHLYIDEAEVTDLVIPNSVKSISRCAFRDCYGITSLTIPSSVESIGYRAFENCTGLTSIIIGSGIKTIGTNLFANCPEIKDVYCYAESVPTAQSNSFKDSYIEYATLHVPAKLLEAYKAKSPWSNFKDIVAIEVPKHTLTYTVDGTIYKTYSIEEGETVASETVPTKEGYTFSGWSEIPSTMPDHDVTVTGTFTVNKYKLTYMVDGTEFKSSEIEYGSTITPEDPPSKEGYTFSGWSEIPSTMPANDVTVTGTFTINKYTVTYKIGDEVFKTEEIEYNSAITTPDAPAQEGYSFAWADVPGTMPANNVTITGTYTINKYTVSYIIDGEVFKTEEIEYNSAITPPDAPAKEGYSFAWADVPETMPAHDITINGSYTTGIDGILWNEGEKQVFTPDGKRIETLQKGLNIIRMSDGTTKKVVVK